jgi:anti-anti-sigma factor
MEPPLMFELVISEPRSGIVVVSIVGELDLVNAPRLRADLMSIISAEDSPSVVLDLAGVDLLDPTGIGVILDGVKRTRLRGGDLALTRAEPQVRRDLDLMRVSEILPIHDSVDAACDVLSREQS